MKKTSYLLITFVALLALMVASADARGPRGGHGGGNRGYHGGWFGRGYYGVLGPGYYVYPPSAYGTYQIGNKTCVWNGYRWRCYLNPSFYVY